MSCGETLAVVGWDDSSSLSPAQWTVVCGELRPMAYESMLYALLSILTSPGLLSVCLHRDLQVLPTLLVVLLESLICCC